MTPPTQAAGALPRTTDPVRRPVGPRRVSGPARRAAPPVPVAPPLRRLVDHRLLDRLIRGRMWIGVVAFALIGIVTMQVALLKLNAGIGRSVQRATVLQRANSLLAAEVSTLQASDLQRAQTAAQGMVYAPPGDVRYLTAGQGDAVAAAATMVAPGHTGSATGQTTTAPGASPSQTTAGASANQATAGASTSQASAGAATGASPSQTSTRAPTTTADAQTTTQTTPTAPTVSPLPGSASAGSQPGGLAGGAVAGAGG